SRSRWASRSAAPAAPASRPSNRATSSDRCGARRGSEDLRRAAPSVVFDYPALFRLDGRRALVAAAGSGIGRTSAEALAAFGAQVTCADVDLAAAERTAAAISAAGHRS